jgi:large subunit ribosomal protein L9
MKIVFIKDVPKSGKKNEIKEVADGFAKFLITNGSAVPATGAIVQKIESEKTRSAALKEKSVAEFKELVSSLKAQKIKIEAKVSTGKHLFSGVRAEDIASAIEKQLGIILNPKLLKLSKPIKEVGVYTIALDQGTMHGEVEIEIVSAK